jgi:hypothetical protein
LSRSRLLVVVVLCTLGATAAASAPARAAQREAHYTDGAASGSGPLNIAEAHATYGDQGQLTVTMRFAQPAPDPLPVGAVLRWTVSSTHNLDDTECPATRDGDVAGTFSGSPSPTGRYRIVGRQDELGNTTATPLAWTFSADRYEVTTTVDDPAIADRDPRCIEATSDVSGPSDAFDTTELVPFLLPLEELAVTRGVRKGGSSKRPGRTTLKIGATDGAKVTLKVRRNGRLVLSRRFTSDESSPFSRRFRWSCNRTGTFRFTIQARDSYGKTLTKHGRWTVSAARCARLRAAERRAAERRAAERRAAEERRRQEEQDEGGGGGGCAPGYSPCLPIVDDLDCADIDGSVTVTGSDQYRLDSDNDGVGCED